MFKIITEGRHSSCHAPIEPCTCRRKLLATTGSLALLAGLTQWGVGYSYSMAALSEALHAAADSIADFFGIEIERRVINDPHKEAFIRASGDKIIASLLVLGAFVIINEAHERWVSGFYPVWLLAILLVSIFGISIDLLRIRMFRKARKHSDNTNLQGLIVHALSDAQHKGIITVVVLIAMSGTFLGIERGLYEFLVRLSDYLASLGLALYMMFILSPRIWQGKGCGHVHHHKHGAGCNHD